MHSTVHGTEEVATKCQLHTTNLGHGVVMVEATVRVAYGRGRDGDEKRWPSEPSENQKGFICFPDQECACAEK